MVKSRLRKLLLPLTTFALVLGLMPPPAAAGGGGWPLRLPEVALAAFPGTGSASPPAPAQAAAPEIAQLAALAATGGADPAGQGGDGGGELLDVYTGLDGAQPGASQPGPASEGSGQPAGGVADQVREAIDADGSAPVIVRLQSQPDMATVEREARQAGRAAAAATGRAEHGARNAGQLARDAERAARGRAVVQALQQVAEASQPPVRALLTEQATDVREFWVFNGFAATVDAAGLAALAAHPEVASVTLDETIVLDEPVLTETGEPLLPVWSLESINAPEVWGEHGVRGDGIVVGVMDSGVDGGHPALASSWRGHTGDPAASWFVPTGENYPTPGDGNGHGTHVTGSIVGAPPGEVTGVAPEAEWIAAKIFTDFGSTSLSIIHAGFEWMLAPGGDPAAAPHVVNNSWGSDLTHDTQYWDAVAAWVAAGIVPIFSNGNNGPGTGTVGSPASFPHAIGIGATDQADRAAWFSSRGPVVWDGVTYSKPQVSAPGYQVFSAWPQHLPNGPYHTISGTSMAAPHATGVVALMLSAQPDLTVEQVREVLEETARAESHMSALPDTYGAGVIDAHAAVARLIDAGALTGVVTGPDGEPVPASVTAGGVSTTADAAGHYTLWLPAGTHQLTVSSYGYREWTGEVSVVTGGTVPLDLGLTGAPAQALTGTVTGPAGPLAGARVVVPDTPVAAGRTDAEGRFALTIAEGAYPVQITAAGHTPATVEVTVAGPTELPVALAASAGAAPQWAHYQNNPARTGRSSEPLAGESIRPDWTAHAGGDVFFASPVIADGRAFVNTDNGRLVAFDATTGAQLWTYAAASTGLRGAPAVASGVVYTGGGLDGGFHAVDAATGAPIWSVPTPGQRTIYTTPVVSDGVVYLNTGFTAERADAIYALSAATGEQLWSAEVGERAFFGPAVGDGLVLATSAGARQLIALDATTGARVWTLNRSQDEFIAGPSIADGTVYVTTSVPPTGLGPGFQGSLLAVDAATGELRWEVPSHGDGQGSIPAVYGDLVIAGSHGAGVVAAYHRDTGAPAWHYGLPTSGGVSASILVSGDGYVVGGSQLDQRLFILDAGTGELIWEQPAGANILSSPAYAEGRLVTAESNGTIRGFHPTGQIAGTVTGPDGPLAASVRLRETGEPVETDPETGGYHLEGLAPGEYTVEALRYGFTSAEQTVTVAVAQTTTVDFVLTPVGDGGLAGTVTDAAGQPLAGATVALPETPLAPAVTGPDGGYAFPSVAAGQHPLVVDADGYARVDDTVTIVADETTRADYALDRFDVAVVADYEGRVTEVLTGAGVAADRVSFAQIDGTVDRYRVVVVVGMGDDRADADLERFARLVDDADAAGTSLVVLGTGGPSYGALRTFSRVTGDPATEAAQLSNRGPIWLEDVVPHPITASLAGGRVPLLTSGSWHSWFSDYSGHSLASLGSDRDGRLGDGIGYQRRTLSSNHILLSAAAPSPWSHWEPALADLLVDAVDYAGQAAYGAVHGQVTGPAGTPVAAQVEVVGGVEQTVADQDGQWRLLLEPGEHTLRFRALGAQTVEQVVTVVAGATQQHDVALDPAPLGTIAGQVSGQGTDAPITGVAVTVAGTGLPAATTGSDGRYVIEDVPGGSYQVEFSLAGYEPLVIEDVSVTEGAVTTLDAGLARAPGVVVIGDRNGEISGFLEEHSIPAEQAGWEVTEALDGFEVAILHNPPDLGRDEFLAALSAFDEAGVSVIFPADGWSSRTRGIDLLVRHTGSPSGYSRLGGIGGPEIYLRELAEHPVFAGVEGDPVQLLTAASEAAAFPDYQGITLAQVGAGDTAPAGIGVGYDVRTPDNVHLLLTGLASTLRNNPAGSWTPDGKQIFLNAVRWAADPGQGGLAGAVTDAAGSPIPDAVVEVVGSHWRAVTDADGGFEIGVPPGEHLVRYSAFGYLTAERTVTVGADQTLDISAELTLTEVGGIAGVVRSGGATALAGVSVTLLGTPYRTETGSDGSYRFGLVEPGSYELELEVEGHVRTLSAVSVSAGADTDHDVALRPSPLVGIIDDSDFTNSRDRGEEFLRDWGYEVEDIGFGSLDRIGDLDLVVANVSDFALSLDRAGLRAFEEEVNRAGVPVLWLGQHGRGGIAFLHEHDRDPAVLADGFNDGPVSATVVEDHPLVAGLPAEFPLMVDNGRYSYFDEFAGTAVASLATGADGERGGTIAYRGRTAGTVDVLLSTMSVTTWGAPPTRSSAGLNWAPGAERVLVNALAWAIDADGIGAEVRGTVLSDRDGPIDSQVEVVETGRTYPGRAGDGSFLVPLAPGDWTLSVSAFGHTPQTVSVTVSAGEVRSAPVTLTADPAGTVAGTITGPDGSPVPDAQVSLLDTPLSGQTGAAGGYTVGHVPAGQWTVRVTAAGHLATELPVTVTAGQTSQISVQLRDTASIAIVDNTGNSSHGNSLSRMLTADGYEVELVSRTALAEFAGRVDEYQLVIFNATFTAAQQEPFLAVVDAAEAAAVSTIHTSQFGSGHSIGQLSALRGDPESVDWGFVTIGVDYLPITGHPIFAGFPAGEPIELITSTLSNFNQQWGSYAGWSGETIGHVQSRTDGADLGEAVGYRFTSPTSVEVLLGSLAASGHGWPDERWTDNARQIYRNAVGWAIDARQAELAGVVTGGGAPLGGATVSSQETGATAVTAADGTYTLGLTTGAHTIEVAAFGFEGTSQTVQIPESGTVTLDVDLAPLPRGEVTGVVRSASGEPVAAAELTGLGQTDWSALTGPDGAYTAVDLLPGDYQVSITATGFLPVEAEVTVVGSEVTTLDVTLSPTDVGVLGDVNGALTGYLRDAGVPAAELAWDATIDLHGYEVVVVNGGDPSAEVFAATLAAADQAQVSLVFTGTWAVDRGGIRLLERYTDRVTVGAQGFGDGPVQLTGFDGDHPVFDALDDPATLIVDGGYYSVLDSYVGEPLAELLVTRPGADPVTGLAAGWAPRTSGSVEVLLSASAVTEAVGPGLGWTADGAQLLINAIDWARDQAVEPPSAPTLTLDASLVVTETVTATGVAEPGAEVTVLRGDEPVATVTATSEGQWSAQVPLLIGTNELVAVAANSAGQSPPSAPVTATRWQATWEVRGQTGLYPITLGLTGPSPWRDPAQRAELVVLDADGAELHRTDLQWVSGFYLHVLRGLPAGEYTLRAELLVDGELLIIEGPPLP